MLWYQERTYRDVGGRRVPGFLIPAFIHNYQYHVASIGVYQDGVIDCWGLMSFDEFRAKVAAGWVVTRLPEGATVCFGKLGHLTATNCRTVGDGADLVKDVANALDELNGRPIAVERLIDGIKRLKVEDTQALRRAYDDLPAYDRQFVFGTRLERHREVQQIIAQTPPD